MLILAGVTINIAVNGGLFGQAKEAQEKTIQEQGKEDIIFALSEMQIDELGNVDLQKIHDRINEYTDKINIVYDIEENTLDIEHENGYIYTIDEKMQIIFVGKDTDQAKIEINLTSTEGTNLTNSTITATLTYDAKGIEKIAYLKGKKEISDFAGDNGNPLAETSLGSKIVTIPVTENGVYTVYAKGKNGAETVNCIQIANVAPNTAIKRSNYLAQLNPSVSYNRFN
jgi:hypothetical protein